MVPLLSINKVFIYFILKIISFYDLLLTVLDFGYILCKVYFTHLKKMEKIKKNENKHFFPNFHVL